MAIGTSGFEAIKDKARKMIHEDAKVDSKIIKERQADRYNPKFFSDQPNDAYSNVASLNGKSTSQTAINEEYVDNSEDKLYAAMDERMRKLTEAKQTQQTTYATQPTKQYNKKLPKEILESFSNNYIDQSAFDPNRSILDTMGITGDSLQQESYTPTPNRNVSKIDYEMIKAIVESSVKKYVNALGKKMLSENKSVGNLDEINAIQITDKKIAIVTKDGNLFEGKLVFKKNIKGG